MRIPLKQYWHLHAGYLEPLLPSVVMLAVLLFGSIALQLGNPQIVRSFIDTAKAGGSTHALLAAALLFLGITALQQVVSVSATFLSENVAWKATNRLRRDLAAHCLALDIGFHHARTPGELIERIDGDVTTLANFFSELVVQVLGDALLLMGVLLLLFREDWRIGAVMTGFAAMVLAVLHRLRDIATPHWAAGRQASAEMAGFLEERMAGTEDIRSSGATAYVMSRLYPLMRTLTRRYRQARITGHLSPALAWFSVSLGLALGLGQGAYLYRQGAITLGTVYLISSYAAILAQPLTRITDQVQDLQQARAGIGRIQELFRIRGAIADGPGAELRRARSRSSSSRSRLAIARRRRCCGRSPFGCNRAACWDCWAAPAAGKARSRGCCSASMIRRRASSDWAASIRAPPASPTSAAASGWSPRTSSSSTPRFATT